MSFENDSQYTKKDLIRSNFCPHVPFQCGRSRDSLFGRGSSHKGDQWRNHGRGPGRVRLWRVQYSPKFQISASFSPRFFPNSFSLILSSLESTFGALTSYFNHPRVPNPPSKVKIQVYFSRFLCPSSLTPSVLLQVQVLCFLGFTSNPSIVSSYYTFTKPYTF